jgi:hypothetical protein
MDVRRLRAGEWITAASGILLALSLFLPWYTLEARDPVAGRRITGALHFTAWEAFSVIDVLLMVLALLAVGLLILTAVQPTAAVGIAADALLTILAGIVAIVTLIRVLDIPGSLESPERLPIETARAPFAWIGLAAVFGVLLGALVAMRDERLSKAGERTDATGIPIAAPPEIEVLPAPPRE